MSEIRIEKLCKSFGENSVLQNVDFTMQDSENVLLFGPSGCGKTTFLRILMGFEKADAGVLHIQNSDGQTARISAVFQEDRLCEDFSVLENACLALKKPDLEMVKEQLLAIGFCEEDIYKTVRECSGGMKRRIAILRAVLADSDLLLLDEPFKGLDVETKSKTIAMIQQNMRGRNILLVSHDMGDAVPFHARIFEL